ncbi:MAG: hypothetical protein ACI33K_13420 [Clostridiaceae bacterium]
MIEDDVVLSYGGDEELPEITIRKRIKVKKNKASGAIVTMLYEEGKRVSWIYLLSLILYFSAVALELYLFFSIDQEVMATSYGMDYYQQMSYESYIFRSLFTIKSLYIGLGILLIIAAVASVILWRKGKKDSRENYRTSFAELKERRILYTIRLLIAFLGYISFFGGYFILLSGIDYLAINGVKNEGIMQYSILYFGGRFALPVIYASRYIIIAGVLAAIALTFLVAIAKIHKSYILMTTTILAYPLLGVLGFWLYKNDFLYYQERRLVLIVIFLVIFSAAVYLTDKVAGKASKKGEDII